jgi:hypothetical protein
LMAYQLRRLSNQMAEGVGFEPTEPFGSPVFKTEGTSFNRLKYVLLTLCLN